MNLSALYEMIRENPTVVDFPYNPFKVDDISTSYVREPVVDDLIISKDNEVPYLNISTACLNAIIIAIQNFAKRRAERSISTPSENLSSVFKYDACLLCFLSFRAQ